MSSLFVPHSYLSMLKTIFTFCEEFGISNFNPLCHLNFGKIFSRKNKRSFSNLKSYKSAKRIILIRARKSHVTRVLF